jgi:hypothetical protein
VEKDALIIFQLKEGDMIVNDCYTILFFGNFLTHGALDEFDAKWLLIRADGSLKYVVTRCTSRSRLDTCDYELVRRTKEGCQYVSEDA